MCRKIVLRVNGVIIVLSVKLQKKIARVFQPLPIYSDQAKFYDQHRGDRFDSAYSNANNSQTSKDKKLVFASREKKFLEESFNFFNCTFANLIL